MSTNEGAPMDDAQFHLILERIDLVENRIAKTTDAAFTRVEGEIRGLNSKFDVLEAKVDTLNFKVDTGFAEVNKRLDGIERKVDGHLTRIEALETK